MTLAVLNIEWQTLADATALGAIYALMAVGIGLVFGVLRLVNFAYGQLVMAGAYALALASQWGWPLWAGIVLCFAVLLVEQRAQRTVAAADRSHVLANGELQLTLGPQDAGDTERLVAAYLS